VAEPAPKKRLRRAERPRPVAAAVPHAHAVGTPEVDWLIHERLRLAILSALAVNDSLTFNELKALIHATDGNLSVHARKLEQARYISCAKTYEGRLPKTEFRITEPGRRALLRYLDHMEALIFAMRERR
jgi:DNA-binding PadR family transcriptional regulator